MERFFKFPKLAANYVILSGAEFISKLLAAVALAFLARVLGPASYGSLEFAIAIYFISYLFVDSGLSYIGAREMAKDEHLLPGLFVHITLARTILAVVAFALLAAMSAVINQPREVKTLILLYGLVLFILPWLTRWVFQGRDMMQYVALASLTRWSVFAGLVFLLVHRPEQVWLVPVIEGAAQISVVVILLAILIHFFGFPKKRISLSQSISLYRKAVPIGASEVVWAIKMYFATILLGFVIGGAELGWFTAAHRIVIALHAFVWLYFYNMLPSISRASQQAVGVLLKLMKVSIQVTAWAGIFLAVYGVLFAELGIRIIFGPSYQGAVRIFSVLIWVIPLALMSGHFRYTLIGYDQQKYEFFSAAIGASVNILLNLILVRQFGLFGAAISLVISEAVIWLAAYVFVNRTVTRIPVIVYIWKPFLGGIILSGALYFMRQLNVFVAGAIGLGIYIVIIVLVQPDLFTNLGMVFQRGEREINP